MKTYKMQNLFLLETERKSHYSKYIQDKYDRNKVQTFYTLLWKLCKDNCFYS